MPRLYGGKTSDWVQGGEWAEMVNHLALLVEVQMRLNVEFVFYFDGAGQVRDLQILKRASSKRHLKNEYYNDWAEKNKKQQVFIKKIW